MKERIAKIPAMTVGQLAARWGVSRPRVQALINCGEVKGAFKIPSAGQFGQAVKIPFTSVLEAEAKWGIKGNSDGQGGKNGQHKRPPNGGNGSAGGFRHFPELDGPTQQPPEDSSDDSSE